MKKQENNLIVRCSSLHKIMTKSRTKGALSETAKSYVHEQVKEVFYGIRTKIEGKFLDKGIRNEDKAIEMVNDVRFMDYRKNKIRKTNEWLTGECDIEGDNTIIDVKCSWSFDTFPAFNSEAEKMLKKSGYDYQVRGYMMLYNKPEAEVIWCMTSTPDDLLSTWDNKEIHKVDHIEPELRITGAKIKRDKDIEKQMLIQYELANTYFKECLTELENKNK
tara:strand:- start:287 stop:943 length:657 start_codon:yes stop_codon:yes gene_type:complete